MSAARSRSLSTSDRRVTRSAYPSSSKATPARIDAALTNRIRTYRRDDRKTAGISATTRCAPARPESAGDSRSRVAQVGDDEVVVPVDDEPGDGASAKPAGASPAVPPSGNASHVVVVTSVVDVVVEVDVEVVRRRRRGRRGGWGGRRGRGRRGRRRGGGAVGGRRRGRRRDSGRWARRARRARRSRRRSWSGRRRDGGRWATRLGGRHVVDGEFGDGPDRAGRCQGGRFLDGRRRRAHGRRHRRRCRGRGELPWTWPQPPRPTVVDAAATAVVATSVEVGSGQSAAGSPGGVVCASAGAPATTSNAPAAMSDTTKVVVIGRPSRRAPTRTAHPATRASAPNSRVSPTDTPKTGRSHSGIGKSWSQTRCVVPGQPRWETSARLPALTDWSRDQVFDPHRAVKGSVAGLAPTPSPLSGRGGATA